MQREAYNSSPCAWFLYDGVASSGPFSLKALIQKYTLSSSLKLANQNANRLLVSRHGYSKWYPLALILKMAVELDRDLPTQSELEQALIIVQSSQQRERKAKEQPAKKFFSPTNLRTKEKAQLQYSQTTTATSESSWSVMSFTNDLSLVRENLPLLAKNRLWPSRSYSSRISLRVIAQDLSWFQFGDFRLLQDCEEKTAWWGRPWYFYRITKLIAKELKTICIDKNQNMSYLGMPWLLMPVIGKSIMIRSMNELSRKIYLPTQN